MLEFMPSGNPFQDPLRFERRVPECTVVIFGANGDLTKRKLLPALYRLAYEQRLSPGFAVVGISRTPMTDDRFRENMRESVARFLEDAPFDEEVWTGFATGLFYMAGDVNDPVCYQRLATRLRAIEETRRTGGNVLFYLSTQPSQYAAAARGIGAAGIANGNGWRRLVVEKPFGHDLESARVLSDALHEVFNERDVYRIDHYLGKETVQNILAFRFGNGIFEPLWNRRYINHVQITAAESIGVEGRGSYYQEAGSLRDMIQNHLLQVMATIAMEPSATFDPDAVRDERAKLLRSIHVMKPDEVAANAVAGQYGASRVGAASVLGFREEPGVDPQSRTDTYAAATFFVENWRWAGVPFYLRTGKALPKRASEIAVQFKEIPRILFNADPVTPQMPNLLTLRIQPEEGLSLSLMSRVPGTRAETHPVDMSFKYGEVFGTPSPEAYERLLLDVMTGDASRFMRRDAVEVSWAWVTGILEGWKTQGVRWLPEYPAGSWGPVEADRLIQSDGRTWRIL